MRVLVRAETSMIGVLTRKAKYQVKTGIFHVSTEDKMSDVEKENKDRK